MTYSTPDIDTISLQGAAAIKRFLARDTTLPRSVLGLINKILAGVADGLYADIDAAAKDIIYDTASEAALIRWAGIWDLTLKAPTAAKGIVSFGSATGTVTAGSIFTRADGVQYSLDVDVPLLSGIGGVGSITCLSAGSMTTLTDGAVLTITSPLNGVPTSATVAGYGLTSGTDIETPAELLVRLLNRIRQTPQGGARADYEGWALAVSGVTRVWVVSPWNGPGTVGILFMCDDRANPIPLAGDVTNVQTAIDAVRPVTARSYAVAPTGMPLNFVGTLTPSTTVTQAAVNAKLADLISTQSDAEGGTLPISQIRAAISNAAGITDYVLTAPAADVTRPVGSITTMGTTTWG